MRDDSDPSLPVYRSSASFAEYLRCLFITRDICVAVIVHDPLRYCASVAEVLVTAAQHAKAVEVIQELQTHPRQNWRCGGCSKRVPGNFDLCWRCGDLHPDVREFHPQRKRRRRRPATPAQPVTNDHPAASPPIAATLENTPVL